MAVKQHDFLDPFMAAWHKSPYGEGIHCVSGLDAFNDSLWNRGDNQDGQLMGAPYYYSQTRLADIALANSITDAFSNFAPDSYELNGASAELSYGAVAMTGWLLLQYGDSVALEVLENDADGAVTLGITAPGYGGIPIVSDGLAIAEGFGLDGFGDVGVSGE